MHTQKSQCKEKKHMERATETETEIRNPPNPLLPCSTTTLFRRAILQELQPSG